MFQRLLFFIAGVDRKTMLGCPATDRMWAAHIGFSLCLSFTVVLGISYLATGYMLDDVPLRCAIALIIAATVFMFDRALFQSDWFVQGAFYADEETDLKVGDSLRRHAGRFLRVAMRLTMSLGLAWVIALFLELALFSATISDKIERDRIANNLPAFQQIANFESELDRQIATRAANLAALEKTLLDALASTPEKAPPARGDELDRRSKVLGEHETALLGEIHQIESSIQQQLTDMNAEELGQKLNPLNSGRTGQGPRYEFAKRERAALEALLQSRRDELTQIASQREALQRAQNEQSTAASRIESDNRAALDARRATIRAQVEAASAELRKAEADKSIQLEDFRRNVMERSHIQAKRDAADPLTRIAAYEDLKSDPKDGRIMTLFSWMTRCLIIFLEIVPVVAKIFFSPPSVYALKVQAEINRARRSVRQMMSQPLEAETNEATKLEAPQPHVVPDKHFDEPDPIWQKPEHAKPEHIWHEPASARLAEDETLLTKIASTRNEQTDHSIRDRWMRWVKPQTSQGHAAPPTQPEAEDDGPAAAPPTNNAFTPHWPEAPIEHLVPKVVATDEAVDAAPTPDAPSLRIGQDADPAESPVTFPSATAPVPVPVPVPAAEPDHQDGVENISLAFARALARRQPADTPNTAIHGISPADGFSTRENRS